MVRRMDIQGKHVVVTGGAGGIGRALVEAFAGAGARSVVLSDLNTASAADVLARTGAVGIDADVSSEAGVRALIEQARSAAGPIDIFISNAGVPGDGGGPEASDESWQLGWEVNVMAHVWASRLLLPEMVERGEGYLINTASAAGLLTQVSALIYSVTKHAAVALAEWLSIEYGPKGVRVSCICPQGVRTAMFEAALDDPASAAALTSNEVLEPADVAKVVIDGVRDERFLILPHPEVANYMQMKAADPERWQAGMRRLVQRAREAG